MLLPVSPCIQAAISSTHGAVYSLSGADGGVPACSGQAGTLSLQLPGESSGQRGNIIPGGRRSRQVLSGVLDVVNVGSGRGAGRPAPSLTNRVLNFVGAATSQVDIRLCLGVVAGRELELDLLDRRLDRIQRIARDRPLRGVDGAAARDNRSQDYERNAENKAP